jgi:hypothetical protein
LAVSLGTTMISESFGSCAKPRKGRHARKMNTNFEHD